MKMQIIPLIVVFFWSFSVKSMAQTTITYTYDSAGNRTGRAVSSQLLTDTSEPHSEVVCSFSAICVKSLTETIELAFTGSRQGESGERKRPLLLTEAEVRMFGEQKYPLALTDGTENLPGVQFDRDLFTQQDIRKKDQ